MNKIILLFSHNNLEFAKHLAVELKKANLEVESNHSIVGVSTKKSAQQLIRSGSALFVTLLSQDFVKEEREALDMVAKVIALDYRAVCNVSMDAFWHSYKITAVKTLSQRLYMPEHSTLEQHDPSKLALELSRQVESLNQELEVDHHDPSNLRALLSSSESVLKCIYRGNKSSSDDDIRIYQDTVRRSGVDHYFVWLNPKCVLAKVKQLLQEEFGFLNPSQMTGVQSPKHALASMKQLESVEKILGFQVVDFNQLIERITYRETKTPPKIFQGEPAILVPQKIEILSNGRHHGFVPYLADTHEFISNFRNLRQLHEELALIAIINGGGTGKSHTIEVFHDHLINLGVEEIFIFSGREVEVNIKKGTNPTIKSLYDIYRYAVQARDEMELLSKEHFELWFLTKEVYFFVDGVEEITGFIGEQFDKRAFAADCIRLLNGRPKGTIVTTSRTRFWPRDFERNIVEFSFSLFTKKDKSDFFDLKFASDSESAWIAKKIEEQISDDSSSENSLPLFCETIYMYVDREDNANLRKLLQSGDFRGHGGINELINRTLMREERQGVTWDVSLARKGLRQVALETLDGAISFEMVMQCFQAELGYSLTQNENRALKRLIFIQKIKGEDLYQIRFSFLKTILLSEYCASYFNGSLVEFLDERNKHVTLFVRHLTPNGELTDRLLSSNTILPIDQFIETVRYLNAKLIIAENEDERQRIISNLFHLSLVYQKLSSPSETLSLAKSFFGVSEAPEALEGMCCIGFNDCQTFQPRFDFEDMTLRGCKFHRYDGIWKCKANEKTHFIESSFANCNGAMLKDGISNAKFTDYRFDDQFTQSINLREDSLHETEMRKFKDLRTVFRYMVKNRDYSARRNMADIVRELETSTKIDANKILHLLIEHGVLIHGDRDTSKSLSVHIRKDHIKHVRSFLDNSVPSKELQMVMDSF